MAASNMERPVFRIRYAKSDIICAEAEMEQWLASDKFDAELAKCTDTVALSEYLPIAMKYYKPKARPILARIKAVKDTNKIDKAAE